jgi:small redox-active disulfide protein 2
MTIQVLGSGCATCAKLHEIVTQAVSELAIETDVEYVTGSEGTMRIIELGGMSSPALVVDDAIVMVGFTPDIEKIKSMIRPTTSN